MTSRVLPKKEASSSIIQ